MEERDYAVVGWRPDDLADLAPDWSEKQRRDFLDLNEEEIAERMIERGLYVLKDMITEAKQ